MVGVQLSGGLGNQMFEYALYLKLKSMGKDVKIDDFTCYGPGERPNQLEVFGISYERLSREEYIGLTDSAMEPWQRVRRKLTGRRDLSYREADCNFDPEVLRREPTLLLGYFQTEKYFADIKEQVREAFQFRNFSPSEGVKAYEAQMASCNAVSLHIRRGDYLTEANRALFGNICDEGYYERAIAAMKGQVPGARFFVFSNDKDWVRARYTDRDFVIVEGNSEDAGYADLYLMSKCKHHILANSSFSWWGAWLDDNPDKKVIAPKTWLKGRSFTDIYTPEMQRM